MTSNEAEKVMTYVGALWPNHKMPAPLLASRMEGLCRINLSLDQVMYSLTAYYEDQQSKSSTPPNKPAWRRITSRLHDIERGERGEHAVEYHRATEPVVDDHDIRTPEQHAAELEVSAARYERCSPGVARIARDRAKRLRKSGFTTHAPFAVQIGTGQ